MRGEKGEKKKKRKMIEDWDTGYETRYVRSSDNNARHLLGISSGITPYINFIGYLYLRVRVRY